MNNTGRENVTLITRKERRAREEESDLLYGDIYWSSALVHLFIHTFYMNDF